ncbi:MarR family winged helix-turn-helix transcriptional regulator [Sphingobacterium yanglingense]|uniref:HTH marR-type domain-containing protein n=1 Tax=Sphingobacterium yanglingense TaxID=1437280 RepID=A0A4R6WDP8_9SPHI|nr:MarR family winged helix-turn-helix transcriptional regulator [Sphingobacterium yanglingense]TDQ77892.1 hypothetical protein CLV99_1861 [Sphingobacterium yanglingense]
MNVLNQAGILALSSRMHRLSEQIRKDGALIYKEFDIDFELKWFPVIYTIYKKENVNVMEIANEIGYTHPSTITLLKEIENLKLVAWKKDSQDERKKNYHLTKEGQKLVTKMKPVWETMSLVLGEISDNQNNLLQAINEAENKLVEQSFYQRVLQLKNEL